MISTLERDMKVVDGIMTFPMKEYPDWYGIKDIGFIYINEWADPMLEYKSRRFNSHDVEDYMLSCYKKDYPNYEVEFEKYMLDQVDEVHRILDDLMEGEN